MKNVTFTQNEVVLKALRRVAAEYFSDELASSIIFEERYLVDRIGKQIVSLIDLPSEPLKEIKGVTRYEITASWFDHLRNQYAPNFLTKRFPIKTKVIEVPYRVEVGAVYPKLPRAFPKYGGEIRYYSTEYSPLLSEIRTVGEE